MTNGQPNAESVPMPLPDPISRFFWDGVRDHKLLILRCDNCGKFIHFPRDVCRFCLSTELTPTAVSGQATLDTWTEPFQSSDPFFSERVPYIVAIVELVEQSHLKMVTNIVDCPADHLRIGMDVVVDFREIAPGLVLPLFKPEPLRGPA
jgi:uncharacterized OB-fold protein